MKTAPLLLALLALGFAPMAEGDILLYNNTTSDTGDTVLYSAGPYSALGDQIQLVSAGTANQAEMELYNNGVAGTFDAELDLFAAGSPVGAQLGSFDLTGIASVGSDVLDLTFNLGGVTVPQNLVFTVTINKASPNMDLGLDMFEPPTVGSSDNSFMIAATGGTTFFQIGTNSENVYFLLSGQAQSNNSAAPEASSSTLLGAGLLLVGIGAWRKRRSCLTAS